MICKSRQASKTGQMSIPSGLLLGSVGQLGLSIIDRKTFTTWSRVLPITTLSTSGIEHKPPKDVGSVNNYSYTHHMMLAHNQAPTVILKYIVTLAYVFVLTIKLYTKDFCLQQIFVWQVLHVKCNNLLSATLHLSGDILARCDVNEHALYCTYFILFVDPFGRLA